MEILICLGIGAFFVLVLRLLFPIIYGAVGYRCFPVRIGMRKFRSYLDIHSKNLSGRVPDCVAKSLVEKSYNFSRSSAFRGTIQGLPANSELQEAHGITLYVLILAIHATSLIKCLESREISKENQGAFALIGDDLLAKCGLDVSKLIVV